MNQHLIFPKLGFIDEYSSIIGENSATMVTKVINDDPIQAYKEYPTNFIFSVYLFSLEVFANPNEKLMHTTFNQKNEATNENCITKAEI